MRRLGFATIKVISCHVQWSRTPRRDQRRRIRHARRESNRGGLILPPTVRHSPLRCSCTRSASKRLSWSTAAHMPLSCKRTPRLSADSWIIPLSKPSLVKFVQLFRNSRDKLSKATASTRGSTDPTPVVPPKRVNPLAVPHRSFLTLLQGSYPCRNPYSRRASPQTRTCSISSCLLPTWKNSTISIAEKKAP